MWRTSGLEADEHLMKHQIIAFLEEYCRGMTLQDVCEWYSEAFATDAPTTTPRDVVFS